MRTTAAAALLLALVTAPVGAETVASVQPGQALRDANGQKVGKIEQVLADGSVRLIYGDGYVVVPASTLTVADGKATTSLTRKDVAKLR